MSQPHRELPIVNPNAAGIDLGADFHWVSVLERLDSECIRRFGCFTADLYAMADWLKTCGIETVAMEATGVYWIPVFQILETQGLEVKLINARHVKTLPGRKSDVLIPIAGEWRSSLDSLLVEFELMGGLAHAYQQRDSDITVEWISVDPPVKRIQHYINNTFGLSTKSCPMARIVLLCPPVMCDHLLLKS